jgi:hypothetical protein
MKDLNASDVAAIARDLLDGQKYALLRQLVVAPLIEPGLREVAQGLDAVATPRPTSAAAPFAAELEETDRVHDGYGYAVWHQMESYQRVPDLSDEVRERARLLRETFVPALAELSASYVDEAAQARTRRRLLADHEVALRTFPVAGGATLYDWVVARLDAGERLDSLVKARAEALGKGASPVFSLRSKGVGLLYRLRGLLADERASNPDLPADLEAKLFGYADLVQSMRARGSRAPTPSPDAKPASE